VTDYDVWADRPVTARDVQDTLAGNVESIKRILTRAIGDIPAERSCRCEAALSEAEFSA
jgi:5'-methylthioadenosine phosphorylase